MSSFTPGPWILNLNMRTSINSINPEKHIAMVNYTKNKKYRLCGEEHEANAYLISATPPLTP